MKRTAFLFLILVTALWQTACTELLPARNYGELVGHLQENKTRAEELAQLVEKTCGKTVNAVEIRLLYAEVRARQDGLISRMVTDLQTWSSFFDKDATRVTYNEKYANIEDALDMLLDRSEKLVRHNCGVKRFVPFGLSTRIDLGDLAVEIYKDLMGKEMRQQLIQALEATRLKPLPGLVNNRMELVTD